MFLIPFVYTYKNTIYPIHIIHIFLNQGTSFLDIKEENIEYFLKENNLIYLSKKIIDDKCYIYIDSKKTDILSFYSYHENYENECWRRFLMIGNEREDFLNINDTNPPFILTTLEQVLRIVM